MRTENSIKNMLVGSVGQLLTIVLGIVSRSIFLRILSIDYLGVSGLFSSILTMLSFAELGIGSAIVYSLYKPLAEDNQELILSLMRAYQKIYRMIGVFVLVLGIALTPFLDFFIAHETSIPNIDTIYVLFVLNASLSYFFAYNRSLIMADQKNYKLAGITFAFKVFHAVGPIVILLILRQYILYLVTQICLTVIENIFVFCKVNRMYPILKQKQAQKIPPEVKATLKKNVLALMIYKIAIICVSATDNILISRYIGLAVVGIYQNYTLIINNVTAVISQAIVSLTASVGNLVALEDTSRRHDIFNVIQFGNFWIYGLASSCFFVLLNPFIGMVFGAENILEMKTVLPIVLAAYILGMQKSVSIFRDAQGLFWQGKLRPLAQAVVNIVASIGLYKLTNHVSAIFWGTVICRITTSFWFDPYIVYKHSLHQPLRSYFIRYTIYTAVMIISTASVYYIGNVITVGIPTLSSFFIKFVLCIVIVNGMYYLLFRKTKEFAYLWNVAKNTLKRIGRR